MQPKFSAVGTQELCSVSEVSCFWVQISSSGDLSALLICAFTAVVDQVQGEVFVFTQFRHS